MPNGADPDSAAKAVLDAYDRCVEPCPSCGLSGCPGQDLKDDRRRLREQEDWRNDETIEEFFDYVISEEPSPAVREVAWSLLDTWHGTADDLLELCRDAVATGPLPQQHGTASSLVAKAD